MKFLILISVIFIYVLDYQNFVNSCGNDCCSDCGSSSCGSCNTHQCNNCCMNTCMTTCSTPVCRQSCSNRCEQKCNCPHPTSPPGPPGPPGPHPTYTPIPGSRGEQQVDINLSNSIQSTNNVHVPINISLTNQNNIATDVKSTSECCNEGGKECPDGVTCPPPIVVTIRVPVLEPYPVPVPHIVPRPVPMPYPVEKPIYIDRFVPQPHPVPIPIPHPQPIPVPQPIPQQPGCAQPGYCLPQSCPTCAWPYGSVGGGYGAYGGQPYPYGKK